MVDKAGADREAPGAQNEPTIVNESNVNASRKVQSKALHLRSVAAQTTTTGLPGATRTTITRTATGRVKFYRAQTP